MASDKTLNDRRTVRILAHSCYSLIPSDALATIRRRQT